MKTVALTSSADQLFAAVADPTRLRILALLRTGELCVCDLVDVLRLPQPKVSRHLGVLRDAGLVTQRIESNWRHYRLAKPGNTFHQRLLDCIECCVSCVPAVQHDLKRAAAADLCCPPTGAPVAVKVTRK